MQSDSLLPNSTYQVVTINTPDISDSSLVSQLVGSWCIGTLKTTEVRSTPYGESTFKSRFTEYQHDFNKCRVTNEIAEPNNPGGNTKVTTTLAYYTSGPSIGQVLSKTVAGVSPSPFANPASSSATYEYDPAGTYVTKVTNSLAQSVSAEWRIGLGVQKRRIDANGHAVDILHDSFGRVTRETKPDGTRTDYQFFSCPTGCGFSNGQYQVSAISSGGGSVISQSAAVFDSMERELQSTRWMFGGAQSHVLTEYDLMGRVKRVSAPLWTGGALHWTTTTYDLLGRPVDVQRPISEINATLQTVHWDYSGLRIAQTDAEGKVTTRWSNAIGQVVRMIDAANGITKYGYDHFGNLIRTEDPANNVATNLFDERGRKKESHDPDMGSWHYTYNSLGQLLKQRDAKLQETTLTYDVLGRVKTRSEAEGLTTLYYDTATNGIGMLASIAAPNQYAETFTYDALGRPADMTTIIDGESYPVSTSYNTQGQVETVTYPGSFPAGSRLKIKYVYEAGMMKRVEDANGSSTVYWSALDTNAAGAVVSEIQGNGISTSNDYDVVSGLLRSRYAGPSFNGTVQSLQYDWDRVGNLKQRKTAHPGTNSLPVNLTENFYYDNLHRLDYSTLNGVTNLDMSYDAIGNVSVKSDVSSSAFTYTTQQSGCNYYGHSQPHALRKAGSTVYCYDQNGNMTSRGGDTLDWYSYNLPKKIRKGANSSEFSYGANRSRFKTITVNGSTTETTISIGALFERVSRFGNAVTEYKHYIPGVDGATAIVTRRSNAANDVRYLHKDHLGSVDTITSETGAIVVRLSYDAFGKRRNAETWSGSPTAGDWTQINAVTHQGFTSHEQLDAVDLVHMKGRVFDPTTGRFVSGDPFVQSPFNSQSFNRYSYVMNNPLSFTDPSGYWSLKKLFKARAKFHAVPTLRNMFEAIKAQPGQRSMDRFILTHRWAYQLGYAAAVVSTYWIGGYGGAVYQAYYTYVATGSMTEAVKAGAATAATQYVTNVWNTGSGFEMSTGGSLVLSAAPNASASPTNLGLMQAFLTAYRRAPATPAREVQERIAQYAELSFAAGSNAYTNSGTWAGYDFTAGTYKCNLFVFDAIFYAGGTPPTVERPWHARVSAPDGPAKFPAMAGYWKASKSIEGFRRLGSGDVFQRGDIVANGLHLGIVIGTTHGEPEVISVSTRNGGLLRNANGDFTEYPPPAVWRYVGGGSQ
jgi:RHS repeat-associated protein